jgi:membrane-bound serine protease (ClpP class)
MFPVMTWALPISDPNTVYLLLVLGFCALVYEFSTPGVGMGAVTALLCLGLAFFSLQTLPLNGTGLALLTVGLLLMGVDAIAGMKGFLIVFGLVLFTLGSIFLFGARPGGTRVSWPTIAVVAATCLGFFSFVVRALGKLRRKKPATGSEALVGRRAEVRADGLVFLDGALWTVESGLKGTILGEHVTVVRFSGNKLIVQKDQ